MGHRGSPGGGGAVSAYPVIRSHQQTQVIRHQRLPYIDLRALARANSHAAARSASDLGPANCEAGANSPKAALRSSSDLGPANGCSRFHAGLSSPRAAALSVSDLGPANCRNRFHQSGSNGGCCGVKRPLPLTISAPTFLRFYTSPFGRRLLLVSLQRPSSSRTSAPFP